MQNAEFGIQNSKLIIRNSSYEGERFRQATIKNPLIKATEHLKFYFEILKLNKGIN
jgi:hypothetical protein